MLHVRWNVMGHRLICESQNLTTNLPKERYSLLIASHKPIWFNLSAVFGSLLCRPRSLSPAVKKRPVREQSTAHKYRRRREREREGNKSAIIDVVRHAAMRDRRFLSQRAEWLDRQYHRFIDYILIWGWPCDLCLSVAFYHLEPDLLNPTLLMYTLHKGGPHSSQFNLDTESS